MTNDIAPSSRPTTTVKPTRIVILDGYTTNPGDISWDEVAALGDLTIYDDTRPDLVCERLRDVPIALANKTMLGRTEIMALPELRYIGLLSTGTNAVDMAAAQEREITVTNVPNYSTDSTAQMAFALIFELVRNVGLHNRAVQAGRWQASKRFCFWETPQFELTDKIIGIIGFGNIGRAVARIANACEMRVIAHTPHPVNPPDYREFAWCGLEELLATADIVSLHCPLNAQTAGMINRQRLATMKPSAYLINVSRGGVMVERDVAEALANGDIAGVGVDVLSDEPPTEDNPLIGAPHCIITPHIAWATANARRRLVHFATQNIMAFLAGVPIHVV